MNVTRTGSHRRRLSASTILLMPVAALTWYPAVLGLIPPLPFVVVAPLMLVLLRKQLSIPEGLSPVLATHALFIGLGAIAFVLQMLADKHANILVELYIYCINLAVGPAIFYLMAKQSPTRRRLLLHVATIVTVGLVILAILPTTGANLAAFDKADRLAFPLVPNSIAVTSTSLVLGLLFAANLATPRHGSSPWIQYLVLGVLGFLIYLLATRFVFLIVGASLAWVLLRSMKQGAVTRLTVGLALAAGLTLAVEAWGGRALQTFTTEVRSFERVGSPLDDVSVAIRVILWVRAAEDITSEPLGYGYATFLSENVYPDPELGPRGFNTHNEFLLQVLALGWVPPLALLLFVAALIRLHWRHDNLGNIVPVGIAIGISGMFETFSNNPSAVSAVGLAYLVLGATLPQSLPGGLRRPRDEVVTALEGPEGEVREDGVLHPLNA